MRPVNIVILVLAGALGGAAVMRVVELRRQSADNLVQANRAAPIAVAATEPAPAAIPVSAPEPSAAALEPAAADCAVPPVETRLTPRPSPAAPPARREARPSPFHPRMLAVVDPPARVLPWARPSDPPAASAPPPQSPPVDPEPAVAPAPQPPQAPPLPSPAVPAARPEPETAAPAPAASPVPDPSERTPNTATLNAGLLIPVRLLDSLSSDRNAAGDAFTATLDRELVVDGFVIAERGAHVEGRVVASNPGKLGNAAGIAVELTRLNTSDGQFVPIHTVSFEKHAEPNHNTDIQTVAGGAVMGAVIGGIVAGGKGAAIGAGAGAGAGAGSVALSRARPATLPSETRITFRLRTPVTLTERQGG